MSETTIPLTELRRVLVIKLRHHGDVLLAGPVLSTLRAAVPQCEVDALVYADTAPMLVGHPDLAQLHVIDRKWKKQGVFAQFGHERQLLRALRARHYDLIVHLTEHPRGAWLTRLLKPRWAVAMQRPGRFWRKSFTHLHSLPPHARRHTVDKNLDALRRLGIQPTETSRRLRMQPDAAAEVRIDSLLAEHGVEGDFIHIHPASRWLFKCWPSEQMGALISTLAGEGHRIVLTAAPDPQERAMLDAIRRYSGAPVVDLGGQLSLPEMAALSARARLFVGVDSAPMHIAAAVGTPSVALFGPSGELEWAPWAVRHVVVSSDRHPCRPCGQDGCGGSKISDCLTTLPLAQVVAACHRLL